MLLVSIPVIVVAMMYSAVGGFSSSMVYPYNKNIIMGSHVSHIIDARKALDSQSVSVTLHYTLYKHILIFILIVCIIFCGTNQKEHCKQAGMTRRFDIS